MANTQIKTRIIHKHDTAANWELAVNFIPKQGEIIIYDKDSTYNYERFKIGDGATLVSALPFVNDALKAEIQTLLNGKASTSSVTQLSNKVDGKVDKDGNKVLSTNDYTTAEKNKLAEIASGAEVNQNAFGNVVIGSTTIAADSKTDTLTFVAGTNITLTPDATNDKITITAKDTTYSNATTSAAGLMSADDKTKLNAAVNKLDGIASGAQVNQNAFSNITDGTTTIAADSTTDTLTLAAGSNISLALDATNDKVTISATNTTYDAAGSSLGLVKSGGDVTISSGTITVNDDSHNHVISNVDGLQNALDSKVSKSDYETFKTNVNTLLDSDDETLDQMSEIVAYTKSNKSLIDSITTSKQDKITGAATTITGSNLTASRVLVSDSNGKVAASSNITTTELGYLDGVTSNLQTQITAAKNTADAKLAAADITVTVTGTGNAITEASYDDKGTITLTKGATFNNYSLPTASSTLGGVKTTSTVTNASGYTPVPIISGVPYYKDTNTTYSAATTSVDGLMSATDKTRLNSAIDKLDGIAANANNYSLPTASSSTKGGVKTGAAITDTTGYTAVHIKDGVIYYKDTNTQAVSSVFGRTGAVTLTKNDVTTALGYTPPTTNTTYTAGTGLSLTDGAFSVKTGYTTSGKNYKVQTDSNGNLYVNVPWTDSTPVTSVFGRTGAVTLSKSDVTTALGYTPPTSNTTYSAATYSTLGLVKPAYTSTGAASLTTAAATNTTTPTIAAKTTTAGRYYAVEADKNGILFVNVPWSDTNTQTVTSVFGRTGAVTLTKNDVTTALGYTPPTTDTNTHYTTRLYAGASGTAANAAATDPYLKVTDDNTYRNQIQFKGGGATTVSSDANGVITISSTDNNTTYTLSSFGITATAAELNYCDGVTSNIQTQITNLSDRVPTITISTVDLVPGESQLAEGEVYFVYE